MDRENLSASIRLSTFSYLQRTYSMHTLKSIIVVLSLTANILAACNPNKDPKTNTSTSNNSKMPETNEVLSVPYRLDAGEVLNLPEDLKEISGITFLPNDDQYIYAVQDEKGLLFSLNMEDQQIKSTPFLKDGDYEDIVANNTHIYILKSNGTIYSFPITEKDDIKNVATQQDLLPKGEYESLAIDIESNLIYALCKECKGDKKESNTSGYILSIGDTGTLTSKGVFKIANKDLNGFDYKFSKSFKPSALTKNPATNEWYILSSANKVLVITDQDWKVKAVEPLNANLFEQPEGIAFDSQNNLYISTEAGNKEKAILYKFKQN
ncbi:SdiA-regulated domain-containing protein [Sphingobacterium sp. SRCM116780]|uniref:SdiA-regulated domain-containing protein n=1 Tax=Sphingobacterium sp. SRCM116780 TaxID=2907623 RepID=UPI001F284BF7|nr:SdiA-regulated domain-containing protein [Sphingobacterium sp. SRCM116780]UIR55813.1 SdiA-regulated domain-containing protein [Sphingobacterium sp. SRCM116780]